MSLNEAMATFSPSWVLIWIKILMLGAFIAPLILLIWRESRAIGAISFVASVASAIAMDFMYKQIGFVKLLGLPHVVFWTPLIIFLIMQVRRNTLPAWPSRIIKFMIVTIGLSLVFDYVDVISYFLGNDTPLATYEAQ